MFWGYVMLFNMFSTWLYTPLHRDMQIRTPLPKSLYVLIYWKLFGIKQRIRCVHPCFQGFWFFWECSCHDPTLLYPFIYTYTYFCHTYFAINYHVMDTIRTVHAPIWTFTAIFWGSLVFLSVPLTWCYLNYATKDNFLYLASIWKTNYWCF